MEQHGSLRSRLTTLAGALTLVLAGATVQAPAASASLADCPPHQFCAWEHINYEGSFIATDHSVAYVGQVFNDKATSLWNRTDWYVTIYPDANYGGGCMINSIAPGRRSIFLADANDRMSSFAITPGALC
ncbi:hypothetical protein CRV15_30755 (plasmid) [Streptomyces clavuligerus]|nr:peptidase inhibitor family I36 protein [Streptomyces clavuligerus]QCS10912.1 hypothetical protein CRV15_30755 [Streptomyces clavuligerus]QPJ98492.1 hypothetical protein GE265_33680 [Streptomyces clavuligerus]